MTAVDPLREARAPNRPFETWSAPASGKAREADENAQLPVPSEGGGGWAGALRGHGPTFPIRGLSWI